MYKEPPFPLYRLSDFPQHTWKGLPVFYPMAQYESNGKQVLEWFDRGIGDQFEAMTSYDVGVVVEWGSDGVKFVGDDGYYLCCLPDNLWVPAILMQYMSEVEKE